MWRLNVRAAQIDECIQQSMFAIPYAPKNPPLKRGDLLLLQLVKTEARDRDQLSGRIAFAIVFDRLEPDPDGSISRAHWPEEGREWPWIVYGSATIPTLPFSLEKLGLSHSYEGQTNPMHITAEDELVVLPYIQWAVPPRMVTPEQETVNRPTETTKVLQTLQERSNKKGSELPKRKTVEAPQFERDTWLAEALKAFYGYRCQVCSHDFTTVYGVPLAETHHIHYLRNGGPDTLENMIVLCPNHHRLVHAANARFDRDALAYIYPNGAYEVVQLTHHFQADVALPVTVITSRAAVEHKERKNG